MVMSYKTQVLIANGWKEDRDVHCTCGHHRKVEYNVVAGACPECGTESLKQVYPGNYGHAKYVDNRYSVIEKHDQGFHIKRQEYEVNFYRETGKIDAIPKHIGELSFSLRDKKLHLTRNGKKLTPTDACVNTFFAGTSRNDVLNIISTSKTRNLFAFCYDKLGRMYYERNKMWGRGLTRLLKYPAVEMFGLSLLNGKLDDLWNNFGGLLRGHEVLPPHKMLGVPKFMVPYLAKMYLGTYALQRWKLLLNRFDGNSVKMIFDIFNDESNLDHIDDIAETLIELHTDYGYTNLKRTILYITREVKLEQGITSPQEAINLLRDFARMSQAMGIQFDRYTKSLKKDHDVALVNYKTRESEIKQKEFAKVIDNSSYADLDFRGKPFSIVRPSHVRDVINEGESLSHCVASYVDDIIKGKCKIVFLRDNKALDESLVTVEVRGQVVRQVRGRFNRKPNSDENAFVQAWAKKKNLTVQNY